MPALRPRAPMQLRLCPILDLVGWRAPLVASSLHCAAGAGACYYFLSLLQYVTEYFTNLIIFIIEYIYFSLKVERRFRLAADGRGAARALREGWRGGG